MFLECFGNANAVPAAILANGRSLDTADSWARVQQKAHPSIRVCSYDAKGAGRNDHVQESHSIDQQSRKCTTSPNCEAGVTICARRCLSGRGPDPTVSAVAYERDRWPSLIDSSHEEMEWRDAAISPAIDPNWNNPVFLRENGLLPNHQKLTWHADIFLVVLDRS